MTPQNFIALDLELNQPSNKVIQVGVAIGNAQQKSEEYVVKKWYLNPNEPIDKFITELTGITNGNISSYSVSHTTVARELTELIKEYNPWLQPVVWGYDDAGQLRREFEKHSVEFKHFGGRWLDVKTIHNFMMFSKNESPRGSLKEAMSRYNSVFEGQEHRADIDAQNTLKFWFDLMRKQNDFMTDKSYNNNKGLANG